ncbi:hypothetical protein KKG52_01220 [Patescibacteria group bacterium]|nr:hypothetical protein [Patescibacteria group bacterium]
MENTRETGESIGLVRPEMRVVGALEKQMPPIVEGETHLIERDRLPIIIRIAGALNKAGLGPHEYALAEQQVDSMGTLLKEDPRLVAVTYTGLFHRERLWRITEKVLKAKHRAELHRKSEKETRQAVSGAIRESVEAEASHAKAIKSMHEVLRTR